MSEIILVPNPNVFRNQMMVEPEPYVPLGLISIATVLKNTGKMVKIVDINKVAKNISCGQAAELIMANKPTAVGFSTMCNQYATTIQIAQECKKIRADLSVIFGGPQATITDVATLEAFPFVDLIVRGECEETIVDVFQGLGNREALEGINGLTFRANGGILRTPDSSPVSDLDALPLPEYGLYPYLSDFDVAPVEVGRGCPFKCTFCSTKHFWQRKFRLRSVKSQIRLIKHLYDNYGFKKFGFKHDNMTVSRKIVIDLCKALEDEHLEITWTCSARADCLDEEVLSKMAHSGCKKIFMGIETGSTKMQKSINKNLNIHKALQTVEAMKRYNISYTASFIIGFPQETLKDLIDTLELVIKMRFEGNGEEAVQLHMLAPQPATELFERHKDNLAFDETFSDHVTGTIEAGELKLIRQYKQIFSEFYYYRLLHLDREFMLKVHFIFSNLVFMPYTAFVLWYDRNLGFRNAFEDQVRRLRLPDNPSERCCDPWNVERIRQYIEQILMDSITEHHYLSDIMKYETVVNALMRDNGKSEKVVTEEFRFNIEKIMECIDRTKERSLEERFIPDPHVLIFFKKSRNIKTVRVAKQLDQIFDGNTIRHPSAMETFA